MRRLIFTDVHANEPALRAVLNEAGHWDEAIFLGDIVGWGPHPIQCAELLYEIGALRVLGNHDVSCCIQKSNWVWDAWTYDQLSDGMRKWILDCPESLCVDFGKLKVSLTHRTPAASVYLSPSIAPKTMADAFGPSDADLLMCGHCHHGIERVWQGKRYMCIRAVGQMRDGDPQTGYTIEENGTFTHHRVPYDIERVVFDLNGIGLEENFENRWAEFLRTAYDEEWSRL